MRIKPIFPNFLAEELTSISTQPILNLIERLKEQRPGAHQNGWQSGHIDVNEPELHELVEHIKIKIQHFKSIYGFTDAANPRISDMWININQHGPQTAENSPPHLHANHWISFVFYVQATPEMGKLVLNNPNPVIEYAVPTGFIQDDTEWNSHRIWIYPQTGLLVAFPSWILHWVEPNLTDQSRISLAINVTLSHVNARFTA